jgi:hypothetical protein
LFKSGSEVHLGRGLGDSLGLEALEWFHGLVVDIFIVLDDLFEPRNLVVFFDVFVFKFLN